MTERLQKIFSLIPPCNTFADVGCDHGYITEAMLRFGKCQKGYFADISQNCLNKASELLSGFVLQGKAQGFCCSGLEKLPYSEVVLIAGMGGEEIISIIKNAPFKPKTFVLQPMKNCDKVRSFLVDNGYKIDYDKMFKARKFYDLIVATEGEGVLTDDQRDFGKDNIDGHNPDFVEFAKQKLAVYEGIKGGLKPNDLEQVNRFCQRLKKYVKD